MTKDELIADLRARDACVDQVNLAAHLTWPFGDELNAANLVTARRQGLNVDWYARRVLPRETYRAYLRAGPDRRATILAAYLEGG